MFRKISATIIGTVLLLAGQAYAADMNREIDYLLQSVEQSGCLFIRNGKSHDSVAAAKHLQMKRERGRRYYDSTEEFIDRLASKSSISGKPYLIDCPEQSPVKAAGWFLKKLEDFRAAAE